MGRNPLFPIDINRDDLSFMQIDVDYYTIDSGKLPKDLGFKKHEEVAVIRMYGVS